MKHFMSFLKRIILNLKHHKIGRCNICGNITIFLVLTSIDQARGEFFCIFCRSFSRKRHVAKVITEIIGNVLYISDIPKKSSVDIYNTDVGDPFYKVLCEYDSYVCSDYQTNVELGMEMKKGVFCQNIEKLTFSNELFDLVITEDVLEHVRNYGKGFKEIHRVLRKGGYHIFTIPFNFDRPTINRVDTSNDEDLYILPPEYHESKNGKVLSYRTYGIDLFQFLESIGFETHVDFSKYSDQKYKIYDSFVFVSKKL